MLVKSAAVAPGHGPGTEPTKGVRASRAASSRTSGPGLTIERYFTRQGVDPFDDGRVGAARRGDHRRDGKVFFEQRDVEVPKALVADRDQRRRAEVLPRHARHAGARALGPPADRPRRRHHLPAGAQADGYFATEHDARGVPRRARAPARRTRRWRSTRRSGSTSASRRTRSARRASSTRSTTRWSRSSAWRRPRACCSSTARAPARTCRRMRSLARAAQRRRHGVGPGLVHARLRRVRRRHQVRRQDPPRRQDGHPQRRPPRHRRVHRLQGERREEGVGADRRRLRRRLQRRGGAYDSVFFQNSNNSVRVTDEFMEAVAARPRVARPASVTDGAIVETLPARDAVAQDRRRRVELRRSRACSSTPRSTTGTPCTNTARINASNPCSRVHVPRRLGVQPRVAEPEQVPARADGELRRRGVPPRGRDRRSWRMEIIVDNANYPTPRIAENSLRLPPARPRLREPRRAADVARPAVRQRAGPRVRRRDHRAHVRRGLPHERARSRADATGPFAGYADNASRSSASCSKHRAPVEQIDAALVPDDLDAGGARRRGTTRSQLGEKHGFRNGQATVLAPTGTIGFMMDCDTTGIEPDIALVKYKRLVGGGMLKIVNNTVPEALDASSATPTSEIEAIVELHRHARTRSRARRGLKDEHLPVFDCAFRASNGTRSIHYMGHIRMMAAAQPFLSGAISKTVNLPTDCTVEDIEDAYIEAWKLGLKAIAVYRDGCKRTQPLSTNMTQATSDGSKARRSIRSSCSRPRSVASSKRCARARRARPVRRWRTAQAARRARVAHAQVLDRRPRGLHHGRPLRGRHAGRDLRPHGQGGLDRSPGLMDCFATAISLALQHGVPLQAAGRQVHAHALRAVGLHRQPGDPDRARRSWTTSSAGSRSASRRMVRRSSIATRRRSSRSSICRRSRCLSKDFISVEVKAGMEPAIPVEVARTARGSRRPTLRRATSAAR